MRVLCGHGQRVGNIWDDGQENMEGNLENEALKYYHMSADLHVVC